MFTPGAQLAASAADAAPIHPPLPAPPGAQVIPYRLRRPPPPRVAPSFLVQKVPASPAGGTIQVRRGGAGGRGRPAWGPRAARGQLRAQRAGSRLRLPAQVSGDRRSGGGSWVPFLVLGECGENAPGRGGGGRGRVPDGS